MNDLGIEINVQTPEQDTWTDTVAKGQFQWALDSGGVGPTPYNFYRGQMSKLTVQPMGQSANENFLTAMSARMRINFSPNSPRPPISPSKSRSWQPDRNDLRQRSSCPAALPRTGLVRVQHQPASPASRPQDNPYAPGVPWPDGPYNTALIVLTTVTPK